MAAAMGHAPAGVVVAAALDSRCARRRVGRAEPAAAVEAGEHPRPEVAEAGAEQTRRLAPQQVVAAAAVVALPMDVRERREVAALPRQVETAGARRRSALGSMCLRIRVDARTASSRR